MHYNKAKGTVADLANDFLNVPFHIFGSHVNCRLVINGLSNSNGFLFKESYSDFFNQ